MSAKGRDQNKYQGSGHSEPTREGQAQWNASGSLPSVPRRRGQSSRYWGCSPEKRAVQPPRPRNTAGCRGKHGLWSTCEKDRAPSGERRVGQDRAQSTSLVKL